MDRTVLNGAEFKELLEACYKNLSAHFQQINDLNVFPVPDGDTGTNMKMTFANGLKSITSTDTIGQVAEDLARGMLFGARGNSGVLTSQYFKGLADGLHGKTSVTATEFKNAMIKGYKTAYKATVDPTEGTILTVAREGVENINGVIDNDTTFKKLLTLTVQSMKVSLDNTPNLLPVLKESGVIDSGGKGLLTIYEGALKWINDEEITGADEEEEAHHTSGNALKVDYSAFNENSVLDFGYCTEFLLQLLTSKIDIASFEVSKFIEGISPLGNSIVCFQTGTIVKVHIHTKKPYEVIEFAQRYGEFVAFKMENMALQHNEVIHKEEKKKENRKKFAVVTIGQGDGIVELFEELGADVVLNGGQTMNTSASEMIDAFNEANSDHIILLPNESNIIMAAKQAASLYKKGKVHIIETKTIPQGYAALSMMVPTDSVSDVYEAMHEAAFSLTSAFISKSIRDTVVDGVHCHIGEYIEGINGTLVGCTADRDESVLDLLSKVEDIDSKCAVILFYGNLVQEEEAEALVAKINERFPSLEVGLIPGKQDTYDYLIGIN